MGSTASPTINFKKRKKSYNVGLLHLLIKMEFRIVELTFLFRCTSAPMNAQIVGLSWSHCMLPARLNIIVPSEMHPVMLMVNNFPVKTQV